MQNKKYVVELTSQERIQLTSLVKRGKTTGYKIRHAQMLLKIDQGEHGPGWSDGKAAEALGSHITSLERLRKRFVEEGLEAALEHFNYMYSYCRYNVHESIFHGLTKTCFGCL